MNMSTLLHTASQSIRAQFIKWWKAKGALLSLMQLGMLTAQQLRSDALICRNETLLAAENAGDVERSALSRGDMMAFVVNPGQQQAVRLLQAPLGSWSTMPSSTPWSPKTHRKCFTVQSGSSFSSTRATASRSSPTYWMGQVGLACCAIAALKCTLSRTVCWQVPSNWKVGKCLAISLGQRQGKSLAWLQTTRTSCMGPRRHRRTCWPR